MPLLRDPGPDGDSFASPFFRAPARIDPKANETGELLKETRRLAALACLLQARAAVKRARAEMRRLSRSGQRKRVPRPKKA